MNSQNMSHLIMTIIAVFLSLILSVEIVYAAVTFSFAYTWGNNAQQQLGHTPNLVHLAKSDTDIFDQVSCGKEHCLILTKNQEFGQFYSVGMNSRGQLGDGSTIDSPNQLLKGTIPDSIPIRKVSANSHWSAALSATGFVYTWGDAYDGNNNDRMQILSPRRVVPLPGRPMYNRAIVDLSLGDLHITLVDTYGKVYGFGYNRAGQTGIADPNVLQQKTPGDVKINDPVKTLTSCLSTSFAITEYGSVYCFGSGAYGLCGDGTLEDIHTPYKINFSPFEEEHTAQISCGEYHAIARTEKGNIYAWGRNNRGQLGNGKISDTNIPIKVEIPEQWSSQDISIVHIESYLDATFIVFSNGRVGAFGDNNFGVLMHHTLTILPIIEPSQVKSFSVKTLGLGEQISVVSTISGDLYEFLAAEDKKVTPQLAYYKGGSHINNVVINDVSAGPEATAFLTSEGNIVTMGGNLKNELAAGDETQVIEDSPFNGMRIVPRKATVETARRFLEGSRDTFCLNYHGIAINVEDTRQLYTWGDNTYSQNAQNISSSITISQVSEDNLQFINSEERIQRVACGSAQSAIISRSGVAYTFGKGDQGLGDGSNTTREIAMPIPLTGVLKDLTISKMKIGNNHFVILTNNHKIFTFGDNTYGQLGNTNIANSSSEPVPLEYDSTIYNIYDITAGVNGDHSLAISTDKNHIYCWGRNDFGQCGLGTDTNVPKAVIMSSSGVLSGKKFSAIAAGRAHSVILDNIGNIYAVGSNSHGQLSAPIQTIRALFPIRVNIPNLPTDANIRLIASGADHNIAIIDYFACYGVPAFDKETCSSNGKCTQISGKDSTICKCNNPELWTGENCEIPLCDRIPANDAMVCSGNGYCHLPNECECKNGFEGTNCENKIPICNNVCILIIFVIIIAVGVALLTVFTTFLTVFTFIRQIRKRRNTPKMKSSNTSCYVKFNGDEELVNIPENPEVNESPLFEVVDD